MVRHATESVSTARTDRNISPTTGVLLYLAASSGAAAFMLSTVL